MIASHNATLENQLSLAVDCFIYRRNINKVSLCSYCLTKNNTFSFKEKELVEYIKSIYNGEIIENDRNILNGQELDVYLPTKKLAFEFNGLYWHSELFIKNDYHLKKTEECEKQGIQLIHIFEDEWEYKQDIIKNKIKSLLNLNERIYARKCIIKKINSKDTETFLNENYIQSFYNSKYNYGLYYNNELVSVMCFNESKNEFILTNFCSKLNKNIIGGSSKLFKYFLNKYNKNIITFVDRHYTNGDFYKKLGFKLNNIIKPSQYQFINNISKNKQKIYKIYNCGYLKYIYYK